MGDLRLRNAIVWLCAGASLYASGCFISTGDDDPQRLSSAAGGSATSIVRPSAEAPPEPEAPPPEPFAIEFAQFVKNSVRWAGVEVAVVGARHVGGRSSEIFVSPNAAAVGVDHYISRQLDPYDTYVQLDLQLTSHASSEVDYRTRDSWDLLLADGTRLQSVDMLGVSVLPGDTADTKLHFPVTQTVDLIGAVLVLEGGARGVLEPERIPLDAPYAREFPRRIESLVGQVIADSDMSIEIDEAVWDKNIGARGRAKLGKRIVWMNLAVTLLRSDQWGWDADDTRVSVGGRATAPVEADDALLAGNTTESMFVAFEIDTSTSMLDVGIPLLRASELHRFSVDLHASVPIENLP